MALTFEKVTGKNVMLLPIGGCDDVAHFQNEKINRSNYIPGVREVNHMKSLPRNQFTVEFVRAACCLFY